MKSCESCQTKFLWLDSESRLKQCKEKHDNALIEEIYRIIVEPVVDEAWRIIQTQMRQQPDINHS